MAKRNKERRAHLKRYASDYINTTQGPRALVTDRTKPGEILGSTKKLTEKEKFQNTNVDQWFAFQDRVKTTAGPKHDREPILNNTFMQPIPDQKNPFRAKHPKQKVAEQLHVLWQGDRNQGFDTYNCVAVLHCNPTTGWKVSLYRNADTYFIQEEDEKKIKRSIFYTRDKAIRADATSKITWVQVIHKS